VNRDGDLLDSGGDLSRYQLDNLNQGMAMDREVSFLTGLFPCESTPLLLSYVKITAQLSAHIHIFPLEENYCVLLLDATAAERERTAMQQKVNDLNLLRNRQACLVNQYLTDNIAASTLISSMGLTEEGTAHNLSILVAKLDGFSDETHTPTEVWQCLNLYLRRMIEVIVEQQGLVYRIMGSGLVVIFGLLPLSNSFPHQALSTGLRLLTSIAELNRIPNFQTSFHLLMGIAYGTITIGLMNSKPQALINAFGHTIDLAHHLQQHAGVNEIIIDENSFSQLESNYPFNEITLRGMDSKPLRAFSLQNPLI
jgi:class 3 adenylate cyclase